MPGLSLGWPLEPRGNTGVEIDGRPPDIPGTKLGLQVSSAHLFQAMWSSSREENPILLFKDVV